MFGSLGFPEILVIMFLALMLFGPKRLPEIGRTLGKALGEFRRATTDLKHSIQTEMTLEEMGAESPEKPRRPSVLRDSESAAPAATTPRQSASAVAAPAVPAATGWGEPATPADPAAETAQEPPPPVLTSLAPDAESPAEEAAAETAGRPAEESAEEAAPAAAEGGTAADSPARDEER